MTDSQTKTVQVILPGAGQTASYQLAADIPVKFTFDLSEAVFSGDNGNLTIAIEGGGTVVLEGYQALADAGTMPVFEMLDGEQVAGDVYLFAFADGVDGADATLETAGEGSSGGSGAGDYSDDAGQIGDGVNALDGQSEAYGQRSVTPLSSDDGAVGNLAPEAADDFNEISESGHIYVQDGEDYETLAPNTVQGNVLANDTDVDNAQSDLSVVDGSGSGATSSENGVLTIEGEYGTLTLNPDGSYTYALNNDLAATQAMNDGQSYTETFEYVVSDNEALNNSDSASLTISITGANDQAFITEALNNAGTEDVVTVIDGEDMVVASGKLDSVDVDQEHSGQFLAADNPDQVDANGGTFHINPDGSWTYTIANDAIQYLDSAPDADPSGATLSINPEFTVVTDDGTSHTITVTVNGANDAPDVFDDALDGASESNDSNDAALLLGNVLADNGAGADTDVDAGDSIVSVEGVGTLPAGVTINPDGTVYFDATDPAYNGLATDQTQTVTFQYRAYDGTEYSDPATVTFTVTGTNDAAEISVVEGTLNAEGVVVASVNEIDDNANTLEDAPDGAQYQSGSDMVEPDGTALTVDGVLQVSDPDVHQVNPDPTDSGNTNPDIEDTFQSFSDVSGDNGYGSFSMDANGHWTYSASNDQAAIQQLAEGEFLTDSVTVTSYDGTDSQVITVTINGTNDAPVITSVFAPVEDFEDGANGWLVNGGDVPVTETDGPLTDYLGRLGGNDTLTKTFAVADGTDSMTIEFDLYEIDSWDNENFVMSINGETAEFSLAHNDAFNGEILPWRGEDGAITDGTFTGPNGITFTVTPMTGDAENLEPGDTWQWGTDQIHHVTITIPNPDGQVHLEFSADLDSRLDDESFGLDNLTASSVDADGNPVFTVIENATGPVAVAQLASSDMEGQDVHYVINRIEVSDSEYVELGADGHYYDQDGVLVDGADLLFAVDGDRIVTADGASFDYEATSQYTVSVSPVDTQGGVGQPVDITVQVGNVNEAPSGEDFTMTVGLDGGAVEFFGADGSEGGVGENADHVADPEDSSEALDVMITELPTGGGTLMYNGRAVTEADLATDADGDGVIDGNGTQFDLNGLTYVPDSDGIDGVLLGSRLAGDASLDNWGEADGLTRVMTLGDGVSVTTSVTSGGEAAGLEQFHGQQNHIGYGIADATGNGGNDKGLNAGPGRPGSDELTVSFEGATVSFAEIGFDGLGGHFDPESGNYENATAEWTAYLNGVAVDSGSVSSDGDLFNSITISGVEFDSIVFSTNSDVNGSNWELRYIDAEFTGSDSFEYIPIDSGQPGSDGPLVDPDGASTVTVEIQPDRPVNQDIQAQDDFLSINENDASPTDLNVGTNDIDLDNTLGELRFSLDNPDDAPEGLTFNEDGSYTFDTSLYQSLADGEVFGGGPIKVDYTASDGENSSQASLYITITGSNDTPTLDLTADAAGVDFANTYVENAVSISITGNAAIADVDAGAQMSKATVSYTPLENADESALHLNLPSGWSAAESVDSVTGEITWTITGPNGDAASMGDFESVLDGITFGNAGDDAPLAGDREFAITVFDDHGAPSNTVVSTISVESVNDAPDAVADVVETLEDTPVTLDVLDNDTDVDGDSLTIVSAEDSANSVTAPVAANGTVEIVTVNGEQQLQYTPDANSNGEDTITYSVSDGNGGFDTTTVTVSVGAVNDAPDAVADVVETLEDTPVTLDVLDNDTDVDGDSLTIVSAEDSANSVTAPVAANGTVEIVTVNGEQQLQYTPDANFNGEDTITYSVSDGNGGFDTTTVTVTVGAVNDAPDAVADVVETLEDTPVTLDVLDNDTDIDGDSLTIVSVEDTANGVTVPTAANGTVEIVTVNGEQQLQYTPDANFNGEDTITYSVSDGNGGFDTTTVTVTVGAVNDAPDAVADVVETLEDTPVTLDVLDNDTDIDGDSLTIVSVEDTANGVTVPTAANGTVEIVTVNGEQQLQYTPDANFNGEDTITYSVSDGNGGFDTTTVTVTVGAVNDAPDAVGDHYGEFVPGTTATFAAANVDVSGRQLAVAENGITVSANMIHEHVDGTLEPRNEPYFQLDLSTKQGGIGISGRNDIDAGEVSLRDGNNWHSQADEGLVIDLGDTAAPSVTVELGLLYQNGPDGAYTELARVVALDENGNVLSDETVSGTSDGTVFVELDGGASDIAQVIVMPVDNGAGLVGNNSDFVLNSVTAERPGYYEYLEDGGTIVLDATNSEGSGILDNDFDADGDALSIVLFEDGTHPVVGGSVTVDAAGQVIFSPAENFNSEQNGDASFWYRAFDGESYSDPVEVTVKIGAVNDAPDAVADVVETLEDTPVTLDVLDNDTDVDGDSLTIVSAEDSANNVAAPIAANGTVEIVTVNGEEQLQYTPDANFNGEDTITYSVSDGNGGFDTTTVTVTVGSVDDPTTITGHTDGAVHEDDPADLDGSGFLVETGSVSLTDVDNDGAMDTTRIEAVDADGNVLNADNLGSLTITEGGTWEYSIDNSLDAVQDQNDGESFNEYFRVYTEDGSSFTDIKVTVHGEDDNHAPLAVDDVADAVTESGATTASSSSDYMLMVDTSGSISHSEMEQTKAALNEMLETLQTSLAVGETSTVSIINFWDQTVSRTFTLTGGDDHECHAAHRFIGRFEEGGGTNYTLAFEVATNLLATHHPDATQVIFMSDGEPTEGGDGWKQLITPIQDDPDVTLVAVGVDMPAEYEGTMDLIDEGHDASMLHSANDLNGLLHDILLQTIVPATTAEGTVLGNDSDPDSDLLTVVSIANETESVDLVDTTNDGVDNPSATMVGTYGTLTIHSDGSYEYTPDQSAAEALAQGDSATESFTYTISDGNGGEDSASLSFAVNGANDLPVAIDDSYHGLVVNTHTDVVTDWNAADGQTSYTANGMTFTAKSQGDPTVWLDSRDDGDDLGVNNGGTDNSKKIDSYGQKDSVLVDFAESKDSVTIEFGSWSDHDDARIFINGVAWGVYSNNSDTFTLTAADDNGGVPIDSIEIKAVTRGDLSSSFTLDRIEASSHSADTASGDLLSNDFDVDAGDILSVTAVDGHDVSTTGQTTIHGEFGDLSIHADGSYEYVLHDGWQTLSHSETETFEYTVTDAHGAMDTANLEIPIHVNANVVSAVDAGTTEMTGTVGEDLFYVSDDATMVSLSDGGDDTIFVDPQYIGNAGGEITVSGFGEGDELVLNDMGDMFISIDQSGSDTVLTINDGPGDVQPADDFTITLTDYSLHGTDQIDLPAGHMDIGSDHESLNSLIQTIIDSPDKN
ncbi:tandem-95 repeat protein [Pseudodesulfovibrio sp. JC047]|uniref:Ig-like domain-containing protein n=1 Tax=Pseudodesulfovibrio sp. JC047 TaxID=2683199 RepID=UPI0013D3BD10|nr:Ig-like domain-containing protein [Pseudodesulfovibrio sp. JC047]NDV19034.1 tandem-95 repeat protein [Pseudodesulfovibrio sp. JC047]